MMHRRAFLASTAVAGLAAAARATTASSGGTLQVATNTYPWGTFASRHGGTFELHSDEALAAIASAGCAGYEPIINGVGEFEGLGARLRAHGLDIPFIVVTGTITEETAVEALREGAADYLLKDRLGRLPAEK